MVQRVGQQPCGRIVGGHQHQHAALEQGFEQAADEHRIADIVDVEFVEAQHPAACEQLVQGHAQGVVVLTVLEHAAMQAGKKRVEVHALLFGNRQRLEKPIEQPAFAAPHWAVQVQAARGKAREQVLGLTGEGGNRLGLAGTQGVALLFGLLGKKRRDRRGVLYVGLFAKQALDHGKHGQCESLCSAVVAYFRALAAV